MAININGSVEQELPPFVFASSPPADMFSSFYQLNNSGGYAKVFGADQQNNSVNGNVANGSSSVDHWPYIIDCFNKKWLEDSTHTNALDILPRSTRSLNCTPMINGIDTPTPILRRSAQLFDRHESSLPALNNTVIKNNNGAPTELMNGFMVGGCSSCRGPCSSNSHPFHVFSQQQQQNGYGHYYPNCLNVANGRFPVQLNNCISLTHVHQQAIQQRHQKPSPSVLDTYGSRLLEDFRAGRSSNLQIRDLSNHVIEFAQDQLGSRFIQQRLQYANEIEKQMVFNEILPSVHLLTVNVFGNYVIQKFFELGTPSQKTQILEQMRGNILNLTLNMYGCRVVQKALERVDRDGQRMIANELTGHILRCVKDQNGNHVVQKVIETLDANQLAFVVSALAGQVVALSTHSYGCRVIQRILERCSESEKMSILDELVENFQILVVDQYGNYVVQHILQHGNQESRSRIIKIVRVDMLRLSQHKFASNVVEKCVQFATVEERKALIADIMNKSSEGTMANCPLLLMMKDQYANYVVQKMLELAEPDQRKEMIYLIRYHMPTLKRYTYGKHIISKLDKYFQKINLPPLRDVNDEKLLNGGSNGLYF